MEHARARVLQNEAEDAKWAQLLRLSGATTCAQPSYRSTWWEGYMRALEHVLAMENE